MDCIEKQTTAKDKKIFVSYAHDNSKEVIDEIRYWEDRGYSVWFDEAIHTGRLWTDEIANAIEGCSAFVLFVTPESVVSEHVIEEVYYALEKGIPIIPIHLVKTDNDAFSKGLFLRIGYKQAILKYRLEADEYHDKCISAFRAVLDESVCGADDGRGSADLGELPDREEVIGWCSDAERYEDVIDYVKKLRGTDADEAIVSIAGVNPYLSALCFESLEEKGEMRQKLIDICHGYRERIPSIEFGISMALACNELHAEEECAGIISQIIRGYRLEGIRYGKSRKKGKKGDPGDYRKELLKSQWRNADPYWYKTLVSLVVSNNMTDIYPPLISISNDGKERCGRHDPDVIGMCMDSYNKKNWEMFLNIVFMNDLYDEIAGSGNLPGPEIFSIIDHVTGHPKDNKAAHLRLCMLLSEYFAFYLYHADEESAAYMEKWVANHVSPDHIEYRYLMLVIKHFRETGKGKDFRSLLYRTYKFHKSAKAQCGNPSFKIRKRSDENSFFA